MLPSPVPGMVAVMTIGPGDFSAPVVTSSACKRWMKAPPSFDFDSTYMVPVAVVGSMTGVLVIPTCGTRSGQPMSELLLTVVAPAAAPCAVSIKFACHSGLAFAPVLLSASNAYTLSPSVATKRTLCVPLPGIGRFARYSGCA